MSFPIDFISIRKGLCNVVQAAVGIPCIYQEAENPEDRRPDLPYIGVKLIVPAAKHGDDSYSVSSKGTQANPSSTFDFGGTRQATASFQVYAYSHEESYNYACLLQGSLDTIPVQGELRAVGIAIFRILDVTDISALLNTGYEGRALVEAYLGIVSNISTDLGSIEQVPVSGEIISESGTSNVSYTVTEEP